MSCAARANGLYRTKALKLNKLAKSSHIVLGKGTLLTCQYFVSPLLQSRGRDSVASRQTYSPLTKEFDCPSCSDDNGVEPSKGSSRHKRSVLASNNTAAKLNRLGDAASWADRPQSNVTLNKPADSLFETVVTNAGS